MVHREAKKKSADEANSEKDTDQNLNMSAPVSRKEAKKRRKATSPEKSVSSSARGQGTFLDEYHNGESASEQAQGDRILSDRRLGFGGTAP